MSILEKNASENARMTTEMMADKKGANIELHTNM